MSCAEAFPGNSCTSVTVDREEGDAVLRVHDNGIGIASELMPRLFDLFTQAITPWCAPAAVWVSVSLW